MDVLCPLSISYSIYPLCVLGGSGGVRHPLLCIWWWQMILFTRVYPKSETLEPVPNWGRYHHLQCWIKDLTFPEERKPINNMSHRIMRLFVTPCPWGSTSRSEDWLFMLSRGDGSDWMQARSRESARLVIEDNMEAVVGMWRSDSCCVRSIDILMYSCVMCWHVWYILGTYVECMAAVGVCRRVNVIEYNR